MFWGPRGGGSASRCLCRCRCQARAWISPRTHTLSHRCLRTNRRRNTVFFLHSLKLLLVSARLLLPLCRVAATYRASAILSRTLPHGSSRCKCEVLLPARDAVAWTLRVTWRKLLYTDMNLRPVTISLTPTVCWLLYPGRDWIEVYPPPSELSPQRRQWFRPSLI